MNVIVEDSCIACGACESICDAVFSIEDKAVYVELKTIHDGLLLLRFDGYAHFAGTQEGLAHQALHGLRGQLAGEAVIHRGTQAVYVGVGALSLAAVGLRGGKALLHGQRHGAIFLYIACIAKVD